MPLSLWTMAPENDFLAVLAKAVRSGFPLVKGDAKPPLMQWTILVPTRRAARLLQDAFENLAETSAVILPSIRPIGDIDEDMAADALPQDGVADAIPKSGEIFLLLSLVQEWARANPHYDIAQDVLASGAQAYQLTLSLLDLVHQCETEERGFGPLEAVYDLDLAGHRTAILSLLAVIAEVLPQRLDGQNLIGPASRRNLMIRREAQRIRDGKHRGPIIAAGSTGTNPATRDLLLAIASHPQGAVVLPGLDHGLDEHSWAAITPEHPQFALKTLLSQWQVKRDDVVELGKASGPRAALASLALRPAATTDTWRAAISASTTALQELLHNVTLVEAADRNEEARIIALAFRQHMEQGAGTAALITPDRDLAARVTAEAARWNMVIDDSSGVPLARKGTGLLLSLLISALTRPDQGETMLALLHHADCTFGWPRLEFERATQLLEIVCFRAAPAGANIVDLAALAKAAQHQAKSNPHSHPIIRHMNDGDWLSVQKLALEIAALFKPFDDASRPLLQHVEALQSTLQALAPEVTVDDATHLRLMEVLESLKQASHHHPVEPLSRASHSILHALATETLRPPLRENARLAIYGLLEARLVAPDVTILGGLVETAWPAVADGGPWLNRPMRESFGLQQPERDIGTTAHDFVQAYGHRKVMITWPRKLGGKPAIPSRWIVRLRMVLQAMGMKADDQLDQHWSKLSRALDKPTGFHPIARPAPKPPVAMRPTTFSVTGVETLVRDSYAVYARRILRLEPLLDVNADVDASLRGSLIHEALNFWAKAGRKTSRQHSLDLLLEQGRTVFAPYLHLADVQHFWWPRFERMARDFVDLDQDLRAETQATLTEVSARLEFNIANVPHVLTARADRIDVEQGNRIRIYDYKSGNVPSRDQAASGFAPQLPLEAALAMAGAFTGPIPTHVEDAIYLQVGGTAKGVVKTSVKPKDAEIKGLADLQFASFKDLLADYLKPETAYLPRHNLQREETPSDYDHLSRFHEWRQAEAPPR
jgi:ATP-dependent helicase/nuclease subunit B